MYLMHVIVKCMLCLSVFCTFLLHFYICLKKSTLAMRMKKITWSLGIIIFFFFFFNFQKEKISPYQSLREKIHPDYNFPPPPMKSNGASPISPTPTLTSSYSHVDLKSGYPLQRCTCMLCITKCAKIPLDLASLVKFVFLPLLYHSFTGHIPDNRKFLCNICPKI